MIRIVIIVVVLIAIGLAMLVGTASHNVLLVLQFGPRADIAARISTVEIVQVAIIS